jgi:hypothetical protein
MLRRPRNKPPLHRHRSTAQANRVRVERKLEMFRVFFNTVTRVPNQFESLLRHNQEMICRRILGGS